MSHGKVLVTGVPGWLGTRFVEMLTENNRDIRCLVLKGTDDSYLKSIGTETFQGDLTKPETLNGIAKDVDTVFHIAGIIHPGLFGIRDLYRINTYGTANILEQAIGANVKRFVYISSNSSTGCNTRRDELMNEYTPMRPYMKYGLSKLLAERAVNQAYAMDRIETVILRPCWYYGPGQPERQTRLMKMVSRGKALLFGDGNNLRSMTYIENLCDALILAEEKEIARGETYWIADSKPYSTLEIYQCIADILGVELKTVKIPGALSELAMFGDGVLQALGVYQTEAHVAGEMNKNIACSIEKAKKDLGYAPKVGLTEGMERSIAWAKERSLL